MPHWKEVLREIKQIDKLYKENVCLMISKKFRKRQLVEKYY
jgi:hypothetical protein